MTNRLKILLVSGVLMARLNVYASGAFTNHIGIEDRGIHLSLSDANLGDDPTHQALLEGKELDAGAQISWILHNTSSNYSSVIFLGMTNSFDFKLLNERGEEVSKTKKGKAMSVGPASLTNLDKNKYIRRLGTKPDGIMIMDFPKLAELFDFPSDGSYVLEVRYWTWFSSKRRFILSDPIRLRVIKEEMKTVPNAKPKDSP
jgi:hypothetical protein